MSEYVHGKRWWTRRGGIARKRCHRSIESSFTCSLQLDWRSEEVRHTLSNVSNEALLVTGLNQHERTWANVSDTILDILSHNIYSYNYPHNHIKTTLLIQQNYNSEKILLKNCFWNMMEFTKHVYKRQNQATKKQLIVIISQQHRNIYKYYKLIAYGTVLNSQVLQKHIIIQLNDSVQTLNPRVQLIRVGYIFIKLIYWSYFNFIYYN